MCLKPLQIRRINPVTHGSRIDVVPCGKCMECTRAKQNSYAFLCSREARQTGSVIFVTLTYAPEHLPFTGRFEVYDKETGQILDYSKPIPILEQHEQKVRALYDSVHGDLCGQQIEVPRNYLPVETPPSERRQWTAKDGTPVSFEYIGPGAGLYGVQYDATGTRTRVVATPSLRREDVKGWLKSGREAYKREYGKRAQFRYFEVGEYGSKRSRPHFHLLFYGADLDTIEFFANRWRKDYGRVDVEVVTARGNDTIQQAYEKVSRYLAKYLCKGEFEKDFVTDGYVERPRRISSKNLGTSSLDDLRAYILGFDVFGEYDPNKPPAHVLTASSMNLLLTRKYLYKYDKNGRQIQIKIPKVIIDRVYSVTYGKPKEWLQDMGFSPKKGAESFVFRASHKRSTLHRKLVAYQKRLIEDGLNATIDLASASRSLGPTSLAFRRAFTELQNAPLASRYAAASRYRQELRNFYQNDRY